ncbi:GIN domain-containing protein [Barnesiella viscericola]|uniref:DUF2807 domain-containing protein n=1 Tax=Barnesiella viscericola TaxID=397865 RepID=A0A921MSB2_9BACT|nr:DUF2807 domain-containing protein [Barnesiella viscericola]HJG89455.1 DUF2807 domain-containing protein [Barnesiella viscericola]
MMKKIFAMLAVCLATVVGAQAVETSVRQLSVDDFYKMKVYNNFDVSYRQNADSAGVVVVMAATGDQDNIEVTSKKGVLTIKYKGSCDKSQMQGSVIVYSTALEYVENNGIGLVQIVSPITGAAFQAKVIGNGSIMGRQIDYGIVKASVLTGSGKVSLTGKCREAELSVTGSGQIEADGLEARDVSCRIMGNGVIGCHAREKLSAWATGNGEVYYRGTPEIKKNSLGELSVRSLEGK